MPSTLIEVKEQLAVMAERITPIDEAAAQLVEASMSRWSPHANRTIEAMTPTLFKHFETDTVFAAVYGIHNRVEALPLVFLSLNALSATFAAEFVMQYLRVTVNDQSPQIVELRKQSLDSVTEFMVKMELKSRGIDPQDLHIPEDPDNIPSGYSAIRVTATVTDDNIKFEFERLDNEVSDDE